MRGNDLKLCQWMFSLGIRKKISKRVVGHCQRLHREWRSHSPWRCSRNVEMWHWGTWSVGNIGGKRTAGLGDLRGLFQPSRVYDSNTKLLKLHTEKWVHSNHWRHTKDDLWHAQGFKLTWRHKAGPGRETSTCLSFPTPCHYVKLLETCTCICIERGVQ